MIRKWGVDAIAGSNNNLLVCVCVCVSVHKPQQNIVTAERVHAPEHHSKECASETAMVGRSSQAYFLLRNSAMDDSIGGS